MSNTILSSKFQLVIPKEIRDRMKLKKGQRFTVLSKDGIITLIPERPIEELRGLLRGIKTAGYREDEDRL